MKRWIIIGASITGVVLVAVIGYFVFPLIASQQNGTASNKVLNAAVTR